jgi:hypothetical protein
MWIPDSRDVLNDFLRLADVSDVARLTEEECSAVAKFAQRRREGIQQAQHLAAQGISVEDIAQHLGTDVAKIHKWIARPGTPARRGRKTM